MKRRSAIRLYVGRVVKGVLCASWVVCALPLRAQVAGDTITSRVHAVPQVSVTGRRTRPMLTSASPLQQLNREEMERMGGAEVADIVRHFSGVNVKDYGGIGGLKTVSIRSMGAQHTAVSYDGVAISNCQSGQVDISRFSLENVSQLSLSIGQGDDIYQTARLYASAGALSIETTRPDFSTYSDRLSASVKTGSYGLANASLLYARRLGSATALTAYADFLRADGNYRFKMHNGSKLIDAKRNNSDIDTYRAELNLFSRLGDKQDLSAKLYLFDSARGLPGSVVYDNSYAAERLYDRNYFAQLRHENRFSAALKLKAAGKFNYSWQRDYNDGSDGISDDHFRQTETYLSATLWAEPLRGLSFSLAHDFAFNHLNTTLENNQSPSRYSLLTVLAAHYQTPRLAITASLLNTYITEHVKTGTAADDRLHFSPAVSLSWRPFEQGPRLRLSYKDIFRVPTFNDMYYLEIGNADLCPETTRQGNVGLTWDLPRSVLTDGLSFSVDAYYNKVKDKIVAVPTMFIWKMTNLGEVETVGVDLNLAAERSLSARHKLYLMGTYSFMQAEDITDRDSKVWRNQIVYTPKHSGSLSLTYENPYVSLTYNLVFASSRYALAQNVEANRIDGYTDHSVSLWHRFSWRRHSLRLQADALNLGGKNYQVIRYYPMPGRNYKLTINYQL